MTRFVASRKFRMFSIASLAANLLCIFAAPSLAAAEDGQNGQIHAQKVCPPTSFTGAPGSYCTLTVSDVAALPANATRIYYDEPHPVPIGPVAFLDSKVVVYVGTGNWAAGRCTVDYSTGRGLCTVSDGTGTLAGFSARIDVRIDFASRVTYWDGTYRFNRRAVSEQE